MTVTTTVKDVLRTALYRCGLLGGLHRWRNRHILTVLMFHRVLPADDPALAQADLGIALGSGSDIAKETGQIILVSPSLKNVAVAMRLSQATMAKIRQNLFLAFIYNVLAIPLAAFGLLNPLIAAAAMALSDVSVLGNSLLLTRKDLERH